MKFDIGAAVYVFFILAITGSLVWTFHALLEGHAPVPLWQKIVAPTVLVIISVLGAGLFL